MRHLVVTFALAACTGHAATSPPVANTGSDPAPAVAPPELEALRALLAAHAATRFAADAQARGCPGDGTLGDYLALLVTNGSQGEGAPGEVHRLTGGCGEFPTALAPVDPPADPAYWYCRVDAYASDPAGESPWHYELRVRVRRRDRAPDLATVGCPGA